MSIPKLFMSNGDIKLAFGYIHSSNTVVNEEITKLGFSAEVRAFAHLLYSGLKSYLITLGLLAFIISCFLSIYKKITQKSL